MLHKYGIMNEESDYRIHVCFKPGRAYIFRTDAGRFVCESGEFQTRKAYQSGVNGATANGYIVPPNKIPGCEGVKIPSDIISKINCIETDSTSVKGDKAVLCAMTMLERGLFHISIKTSFINAKDIQRKGVDLIVVSRTKIEVKCDYNGGPGGTGNLYLQIAERNPLGHH